MAKLLCGFGGLLLACAVILGVEVLASPTTGPSYDAPAGGFSGDLDGGTLEDTSDNDILVGDQMSWSDANGPRILDIDSDGTTPSVLLDKADADTGIGGTGNNLYLVSGGATQLQTGSGGTVTIPLGPLSVGGGGRVQASGSMTTPAFYVGSNDTSGLGGTSSARVAIISNGRTAIETDATPTAANVKIIIGGGMFFEVHAADPCAQDDYTEGGMFFNSVNEVPCYCDSSNVDLRFDGTTACF